MIKKLGLFCVVCFAWMMSLSAQRNNIIHSLEHVVAGQGKVTVHQDARITALIGSGYTAGAPGEEHIIKRAGYRVQVYAGNNTREAKNEAHAVAELVKESFPDLPVYATFIPPRWLCRVGDFLTIEEADAVMRQMRATSKFKEVSIVREQVNVSL